MNIDTDIETQVIEVSAQWSRNGYMTIRNDTVIFDCSDGEYGPIQFPISRLDAALQEHHEKINAKRSR
jgi:hypothetical protein